MGTDVRLMHPKVCLAALLWKKRSKLSALAKRGWSLVKGDFTHYMGILPKYRKSQAHSAEVSKLQPTLKLFSL